MRPAAAETASGELVTTVATYNVHGWVGRDRRYDPARTIQVINELRADVVGLQEAALLFGEEPGATERLLAETTGHQVVSGPTMQRGNGSYGNALLTRHEILAVRRHDLSVRRREPRSLLDVDLQMGGEVVRVLVTHLGLQGWERRDQVQRLVASLHAVERGVTLLLGDCNQWFPFRGSVLELHRWFGWQPLRRTFPARWPLLPLDRIWLRPRSRLAELRVHRSPEARVASDHLPVRACVRVAEAAAPDAHPAPLPPPAREDASHARLDG